MFNCNPLSNPLQSGIHLAKDHLVSLEEDRRVYSQIVGRLMHAIVSKRPDCAYTVSNSAQYLSNLA